MKMDERFDAKVEPGADGCLNWTSAFSYNGYGVFWLGGGKSAYAHRFALERATGEKIQPKMHVMHLCNNKACVNPAHLRAGTCKENIQMAARDGLMPVGERNGGGGKLKEEQVRTILTERDQGCWRMAKRFSVSKDTIKKIRRRQIWRHVQP